MSDNRPATEDEIRRYEAGEQRAWVCPECGDRVEVLSALMVACSPCREQKRLVWMKREAI